MGKLVLILSMVLLLSSCSEDDGINHNPSGNYSGIFTVEYSDGISYSNPVTVNFSKNNNYSCSGNKNNNDFYPAGGSGTYEIKDSKILFSDINIWTANFDWNLILNGEYTYTINGNKLTISANKNNVGFYKYELEKE